MGGSGGVEIRGNSIRIKYTQDGFTSKHTLLVNGNPMPPTPANIKYALRFAGEIRDRIRHVAFSVSEYFPSAGTTGVAVTMSQQLDTWLAAQRIEASTRAGDESAGKFWKSEIGDKPLRAIKHSDVLTALAKHLTLSGKTVNNYVSVLRQSVQLAVLDKILPANLVADVPRAA